MPQYSADDAQFNEQFYRNDLLTWRREQLGWSIQETARRAGEHFQAVRAVFMGKATNRKIYPVANVLSIDWMQVHNLQLKESEFPLAVLNGHSG